MGKNLTAGEYDFINIRLTDVSGGDMPGDKLVIEYQHQKKAELLFGEIMKHCQTKGTIKKLVISLFGGSGVGKSEIAALLKYGFTAQGTGAYVLSGDNYPWRIPRENDAERLTTYRQAGIRALNDGSLATSENMRALSSLISQNLDCERYQRTIYPFLTEYQLAGEKALAGYLGSDTEIDFAYVNSIITGFKNRERTIYLKRMGNSLTELSYEAIDFSDTEVLIIEWTHGGSYFLKGIDFKVLLNSSPKETLEHRKKRNRDKGVDSAFTTIVLDLEQKLLSTQAGKADIILTNQAEIIDYQRYLEMTECLDGEN